MKAKHDAAAADEWARIDELKAQQADEKGIVPVARLIADESSYQFDFMGPAKWIGPLIVYKLAVSTGRAGPRVPLIFYKLAGHVYS